MGISDFLRQGKDAVVSAGSMVTDGFKGGTGAKVVTTVGTLGFLKKSYDLIKHTGEAIGFVDPGVDESGKKKEAAGLVTIGTDALLLAASAFAIKKGADMGRGA
jgi:hypothetical protein